MKDNNKTYCGVVAIVGRSNVGKSTIFNKLLGQKISITSRKKNTTRNSIIGINTAGQYQTIYIDTPGINLINEKNILLNKLMNYTASKSIDNVKIVIFVVEGTKWTINDQMIVNQLNNKNKLVLLLINKIDQLIDKNTLLPHINFLSKQMDFYSIIPICAVKGIGINTLAGILRNILPAAIHHFPKESITDRSQRFIAAEIIRETLIRFVGDEIPYSITVAIESFVTNKHGCYHIKGIIFVEYIGQKIIIIGNKGSKIKTISIEARQAMKTIFNTVVHLTLWVKIKSGWTNDERILRNHGYMEYILQ
ncbi:GTPase Era [Candidatus Palibaumannia cicadellinicola]|uniref:GTPase Era n=1 Tax=Candidatus Palibaumannia cicadellinicola TaxID=186490 RepID=A0A0K2BKV4_9GAMM|nr:GTPase Era [Candidatus Baumannia cicadellinicola]AKZ65829.1 GTP-binding protein [Candidatus Baumannia cicadellinicola]